jgi:hypothetical protein
MVEGFGAYKGFFGVALEVHSDERRYIEKVGVQYDIAAVGASSAGSQGEYMERKGMLKVFVSSTYRDLHAVRGLLIEGIETALDTAAMEKFVPSSDISAHQRSIEELEKSDVCIFIIGDYYGTVIRKCNLKKPLCGDCSQQISFTHCEYRNALQNGNLHMVYILENRILDALSRIQKFDLATTGEVEIYNFLLRNGMDGSAELL